MNYYFMVLLAVAFLALQFIFTKLFQKREGEDVVSGLWFNFYTGIFTAVVFYFIGGCRMEWTAYSAVLATLVTLFCFGYTMVGFKIMAIGNMAGFTLFLMLGGMVLPYLYGLAFLNETFSWLRTIGFLLIIVSLLVSMERGGAKRGKYCFLFYLAVFVLNGFVSITLKVHQIETTHLTVTASGFVMLSGLAKAVIAGAMLIGTKRMPKSKKIKGKSIGVILIAAILGGLSYLFQLMGASALPASVLYPMVTGGSVILTAIVSFFVFHEKLTKRGTAGIILCFVATLLFL